MNLQFEQLLTHVSADDIALINDFFKRKLISEKQFIQGLIKSFGVRDKSEAVKIKTEIGKLLLILKFIDDINLKKLDSKKHLEVIKRLMSDNGHETVNEIICHIGLANFFNSYQIAPLFDNLPDGYIIDESSDIPIEIKSRFPKLFERLDGFYQKLSGLWPTLSSQDLVINLRIMNLNKKISSDYLNEEVEFIKSKNNQINFSEIPLFPKGLFLKRTSELIEYTIEIFSKKSANNNFIGITQQQVENCIYLTNTVQVLEKGLSGYCLFSVSLEDNVRQIFSNVLIKECINNIKNIPSEPRGIAIYSPMLADPHLNNFFTDVIDNYITNNKRTMIIGISGSFNERQENIISIAGMKIGSDIKELIKRHFFKPLPLLAFLC